MNARDHTSIAQERIRAEINELIAGARPGRAQLSSTIRVLLPGTPFPSEQRECRASLTTRISIFLGGLDVEFAEREVLRIDGSRLGLRAAHNDEAGCDCTRHSASA